MPNSNDVASVEMLWERVLSLLVVGARVLGGSAVLLIQALPPIHKQGQHTLPKHLDAGDVIRIWHLCTRFVRATKSS